MFPKGVSVNKLGGSGCGATAEPHGADGFHAAARPPHGTARRDLWPRCVHPGRASGSVVPSVSARPAAFAPMLLTLFLFFLSAAVIYFACEYFVNGVEWVGHRFELGATATGTVLAAFGTALPESAVTFMAVVFGDTPSRRTSAWAPRWAVRWCWRRWPTRSSAWPVARPPRPRDAIGLYQRGPAQAGPRPGLVHGHLRLQGRAGAAGLAWKPWLGILFLVTYGLVKRELSNDEESLASEDLEPLAASPRHGSRCPGPSRRRCWRWW